MLLIKNAIRRLRCWKKSKYFRLTFYRNNLPYFGCSLFYILLQISLVIIQYFAYKSYTASRIIARIGGILLNFNCSFLALLVLKRLNTWLRNSFLGRFLPMDNFLHFHKFIGFSLLICSIVHITGNCVYLCIFLFLFIY
jgi:hypothetical protein